MMKKMMLVAVALIASLTVNAQREVGKLTVQPKIGFGASNITKVEQSYTYTPTDTSEKLDKSLATAALLGAEFEYQLTPMFSVAAGLTYTIQGAQWSDFKFQLMNQYVEFTDNIIELQYTNLPIVLNAYVAKGFALKAGVQLGYLTSAKYKYTIDSNMIGQTTGTFESKDYKDDCKKLDVSIPIGASYEYSNFVFDLRYHLGLTPINKNGAKEYKNSVFMLTFGYRFDI